MAQLESLLSTLGQDTVGDDHWKGHQLDPDAEESDARFPASSGFKTSPVTSHEGEGPTLPTTRVYGTFVKIQTSSRSDLEKAEDSLQPIPKSELVSTLGKLFVTPAAASRLLEGWIKHLSIQYPVIHTLRLKELHTRRDNALDLCEESILHLVYANSGRILEAVSSNFAKEILGPNSDIDQTGETGDFYPVQHYEAAIENIDAILELRDARSVAYLLLLALYCFRGPRNPGAWTIAGLAVRMCIELGFHRKFVGGGISMERELQVRIFWSCYYLDRGISVALGKLFLSHSKQRNLT